MRLRLVAAAAGLVLVGAGCTSDDAPAPAPLPSESPTVTASESPSPSAPTLPPEARGTSPAAAKAFARHYVEAMNFAMASGDTASARSLASDRCSTCSTLLDRIQEVYAAGGRFEGGEWSPNAQRFARLPGGALVVTAVRIGRQRVYEDADADPVLTPATRGSLELRLSRDDRQWRVSRLDAR